MGADTGDISDPSLIRGIVGKLLLRLIERDQSRSTDPITWILIPADRGQLRYLHEPCHLVLATTNSCFSLVMISARAAIDPHTLIVVIADLCR